MNKPIYLDYAATTPVDPQVADKMMSHLCIDGVFGNPASRSHIYGWQAEAAVESARGQVASLINADSREIIWTSGATEADNLAIKGVVEAHENKPCHIITSSIEHKAVLDTCLYLKTKGVEVTFLNPDANGIISPQLVEQAIREDTVLISLMHVNNEIGVINDLDAIGQIARKHNVLFHVDSAQGVGKLPIDLQTLPVDLMSMCAHKLYGPKGIGALYVRRAPNVNVAIQMHGGGHERGMRSGTLATHQIVGMGEAFDMAGCHMKEESERILSLRNQLWNALSELDDVYVNGALSERVSGILNVAFAGVDGESLMLSLRDLAVSSGSACASASLDPSYVLKALGLSDELAHSSIRISIGRFTSQEEINIASNAIKAAVCSLRNK
jgi:cysteine desulfurase